MANLGNKLGHVFHLLNDVIHCTACGVNLFRAGLHLAGAGINKLTNIISRTGAAAGEMANFARDHSKTFALFTRPCCFYRRVERQNIGLESDVINQGGNRTNALRAVGDIIHGFHHGLHRIPPLRCRTACGHGEFVYFCGGFRVTLNRSRHLVHCRDGLLHIRYGLARTIVQIFITLRKLVATIAHAHHLA